MSYFVFDPDPIREWHPAGGPTLVGPFQSRKEAETYANVSHPEDMDGNAVVLKAVAP
jgi:hypothetical protein